MNHRRRRGFTLIELLIVIGIIIVLVGLGFVGYNRVITSQKVKNTGIALDNAKSLFATYQNVTHLRTVPPMMWANNSTSENYTPGNAYPTDWDLWTTQLAAPGAYDQSKAADVTQDSAIVLGLFLTIPENAKLVAGLSPTAGKFPQTYDNKKPYAAGDVVLYSSGGSAPTCWVATTAVGPNVDPPSMPGGTSTKWAITGCGFFDGWGNPVLYVPKGGMTGVLVGGQLGVVCSDGFHAGSFTPTTAQLQSLRPFFVSAGPDGNYATGDDNVYSFEP